MASGARLEKACGIIDIDPRTLQRWRRQGIGEDRRAGPKSPPQNKLNPQEKKMVLETANKPEYRNLSPKQIVPTLADQGCYLGSESTFYRILHEAKQMKHRDASNPPQKRHKPDEFLATGPNQVFSWDITYLKSPVRGMFYYLYMVMDVWSRKVMGTAVHETESSELSSKLIDDICASRIVFSIDRTSFVAAVPSTTFASLLVVRSASYRMQLPALLDVQKALYIRNRCFYNPG